MLQQTRVEAVAPRFEAFLRRWPTPGALAAAREEEVVAAWSGLGYYRRARNLHAAARAIAALPGGRFPRDAEGLRALPGVGEYTAGAVGSLALGLPLPLVDGNVARVLARLFAVRGDPRTGAAARRIRELASALLPAKGAGAWNEALMELGALVCVPGTPRCGACPLAGDCAARAAGLEARLPETAPRKAARAVRLAAALVRDRRGRTLLLRRPDGGLLGGTWELPHAEVREGDDAAAALRGALRAALGGRWEVGERQATVRHAILDRRITLDAYDARPAGVPGDLSGSRWEPDPGAAPETIVYAAAGDLASLPLSSLVTKTLAGASRNRARGRRGSAQ